MLRKIPAWILPLVLVSLLVAACAPKTGVERVAEMRGRYSCEIVNFVPREVPAAGVAVTTDTESEDEGVDPDAAPADGEDGIEEETIVPMQTDVLLDIVIRNENRENLAGLTLDVVHLPAGGEAELDESALLAAAKATWRVYIDTSTVGRGPGTSKTHTLEDVQDFADGDRFAAFVRNPVPESDRGEYREFSEAE